jgi:hypothetical protein
MAFPPHGESAASLGEGPKNGELRKMKRLFIVAISAVAFATPSLADNNKNSLDLKQGNYDLATVDQIGDHNTNGASISQFATSNVVTLKQQGTSNINYSEIVQQGDIENRANVLQGGLLSSNTAIITQDGRTNEVNLDQGGDNNTNWSQVIQTGTGNLANITQK